MTPDTPSALDAAEARLRKLEARISVAPFVEIPTATGDFMRALRNDALAVIDGLRAQLAEARAERRELAQKIIAEIGAPGPETLEETVTRLLSQVAAQLAEARAEVARERENKDAGWSLADDRRLIIDDARTQVAALLAEQEEVAGVILEVSRHLGNASQAHDGDEDMIYAVSEASETLATAAARLRAPLKPKEPR